jgi:hypothetical protein
MVRVFNWCHLTDAEGKGVHGYGSGAPTLIWIKALGAANNTHRFSRVVNRIQCGELPRCDRALHSIIGQDFLAVVDNCWRSQRSVRAARQA